MRKILVLSCLLLAVVFLLTACGDNQAGYGAVKATSVQRGADAEPTPSPNAELPPGPIEETDQYVLPNGRMVWPAGVGNIVNKFAIDLGVSPDGATLAVTSASFTDLVQIVDTETMTTLQELEVEQAFSGAIWNAAGNRFWIGGGGSHAVFEFDFIDGVASESRQIRVYNYPSGLALSPNERFLYVSCLGGKRLAVVDLLKGREVDSIDAHLYSYDVKITSDGELGFVSNTGRATVSVIDLQAREALLDIEVGHNPEGLAISPDDETLYVANSDSDTISVIDIDSFTVIDTWLIYPDPNEAIGASPVAVTADQAGDRLYVACSGSNEITVMSTAGGDILGRLSTGWYATNLRLDEDHGMMYYTSGKGYGSYGRTLFGNWRATVHGLEIPGAAELAVYTDQHEQCLNWSLNFYDLQNVESPIPLEYGTPSEQIKHAIFIIKENKTFDQVFGDYEGARRDPEHLNFGREFTPNHHVLADQFVLCDNLFVEGDCSVLGHLWGTFGILNDHAEKAFITQDRYPLPDIDPATRPQVGTIFERLLDAGIEFRSYGQIIGFMENFERFAPYIDLKYGFWNMGISDEAKADEIIREWELGIFPPFIYISLPNDHTYGSKSGAPTVAHLMGDNDAGLGKIIEWLSNSEYWEETAVFVTEDDPQSGSDHIDPHRTIGLVVSPWAKRGHISSVLYSMSSIWHTIELILGIAPASKYTQYASPMYDCFTMDLDLTPYEAIPNPTPFELNEKGLPFQDYCDNANFAVPDQVSRMGEVLWALTRPGEDFPYDKSLSGMAEDDAEEEACEYVEAIERARVWALEHNIEINW